MQRFKLFSIGYKSRGLNEKQVSEIIGLSVSTLRLNRHKGVGIPYYKMGRSVRYDPEDVQYFLESNKIKTKPI